MRHFLRAWRNKWRFAVILAYFSHFFNHFSHFWHVFCPFHDQAEIHSVPYHPIKSRRMSSQNKGNICIFCFKSHATFLDFNFFKNGEFLSAGQRTSLLTKSEILLKNWNPKFTTLLCACITSWLTWRHHFRIFFRIVWHFFALLTRVLYISQPGW